MKKIHLVGIFFGGFLILFSLFAFPKYNTLRLSTKSLAAGSEKLNSGEIVAGLSLIQHAISTLKAHNAMPANMLIGIKGQLIDTAQRYPLNSFVILEFLDKNGIQPDCDERMTMYRFALEEAIESAKNSSMEDMREGLNIAALWSGSCAVDEKNLSGFRKVFDYYKKANGAGFIRADWMSLAYEGKPISSTPAPPQTPENATAKLGANQLAGFVDKVKQKIGISKPVAPSQPEKTETAPEAEKPAAMPQTPAGQNAKAPEKATKPEAPVKTPAAKPAADHKAAPSLSQKTTPPPITPNKQESDTQTRQFGQASGTGGETKKEAPQSFIQKISQAPSSAISKIKNLFKRTPKMETHGEALKKANVVISPVLAKEIESATSFLSQEYKNAGISASRAEFSGDGTTTFVEFSSKHIGTGILADELAKVLSTIDERVRKTGIIPLKTMSISLLNGSDNNKSVVKWEIGYDDYCKFREKQIDSGEFRKSWGETLY